MQKRKGFKLITVEGQTFQFSWSLRHGLPQSWPLLIVYTSEGKRFEFDSEGVDFPKKPAGRLATWKGKYGKAGWDTYEANYMIKTFLINGNK